MKILVTAIGSMSASTVICSLIKDGHNVIACDIYPQDWLVVPKNVNKFYQVPLATSKDYVDTFLKIVYDNNIDFIIPLTDAEVDVLVDNVEKFELLNAKVCISNEKAIKISRNKLELYRYFKNYKKIKVIPTFIKNELSQSCLSLPLIAKRINGRSSEGLKIIQTLSELNCQNFDNYIFQPFIPGNIYTVDLIRDTFGNSFAVPRKELIRTSNGAGITVELHNNVELITIAKTIGEALNILGCVNLEFIYSDNNYHLMDINPRFSAGISFSQSIGYDFIINMLKCFNGKRIDEKIEFKDKILHKNFIDSF